MSKNTFSQIKMNGFIDPITGDTLPIIYLKPVYIFEKRTYQNPISQWKYDRLVRNVKKAYPYSKIASSKIKEYEKELSKIKDPINKKIYLEKTEKELKKQFESDIRNMTMTQGRILLKLIDRETGRNGYQLLKEIKGVYSAAFWQSIAYVFGGSLKEDYEPETDDYDSKIESIVSAIEMGQL